MGEPGRKKRNLTRIALALLFIVIVVMFATFGGDILREISDLKLDYFLLALGCGIGVQIAWGLKYYLLVKRRVKNAWFPYVLLSNMYGNFLNITTPSGRMAGEPLRARMISKKYRKRFSTVFASAMVDKMTLTVGMILLLIPLTIYVTLTFEMPDLVEYFLGAFVLFWLIVGIISYLIFKGMGEGRSKRIGDFIYRMSKIILRGKYRDRGFFVSKVKNGIMEFKRSFKLLSKDPVLMAIDLSLAVMVYGFRFAAAYMYFLAIGHSQPFIIVSAVVIMAFMVGLISQLPGMVGIGESTMTGLYLAMGVRPGAAITVSLLTQLNVYIFEIGLGYLALVGLNLWGTRSEKRSSS